MGEFLLQMPYVIAPKFGPNHKAKTKPFLRISKLFCSSFTVSNLANFILLIEKVSSKFWCVLSKFSLIALAVREFIIFNSLDEISSFFLLNLMAKFDLYHQIFARNRQLNIKIILQNPLLLCFGYSRKNNRSHLTIAIKPATRGSMVLNFNYIFISWSFFIIKISAFCIPAF